MTAILSRLGGLLGNKITVEIQGEQLGYPDGAEITGRLSSVELASDGEHGGVLVWLSGMNNRLLIRRVVHEDATAAGIENTAGPKWLN
ncbi:hypothetical protein [Actinophytocola sp.]|uniref:hypothetical protein n=1 Tax=Actinophytocola sp. TaxID=1872138 RepID=UPI002D804272|nr:hypothetical protein [Actinophytocola sp.]HET9144108.1 hypothetical protein [Actinophytocola sp.]